MTVPVRLSMPLLSTKAHLPQRIAPGKAAEAKWLSFLGSVRYGEIGRDEAKATYLHYFQQISHGKRAIPGEMYVSPPDSGIIGGAGTGGRGRSCKPFGNHRPRQSHPNPLTLSRTVSVGYPRSRLRQTHCAYLTCFQRLSFEKAPFFDLKLVEALDLTAPWPPAARRRRRGHMAGPGFGLSSGGTVVGEFLRRGGGSKNIPTNQAGKSPGISGLLGKIPARSGRQPIRPLCSKREFCSRFPARSLGRRLGRRWHGLEGRATSCVARASCPCLGPGQAPTLRPGGPDRARTKPLAG